MEKHNFSILYSIIAILIFAVCALGYITHKQQDQIQRLQVIVEKNNTPSKNILKKIDDLESSVSGLESSVGDLEVSVSDLDGKVDSIDDRVTDLEWRPTFSYPY